ncbi:MAG: hypothetical protein R3D71_02675 [Rickettsiales bacterium]
MSDQEQKVRSSSNKYLENIQTSMKKELSDSNFIHGLKKIKNRLKIFFSNFSKLGNITKSNYELGRKYYAQENFADAILRFRIVTLINKNHYMAWYYLAESYLKIGKKKQSIDAIKKTLSIKPDLKEGKELVARIRSEQQQAQTANQ